MAVKFINKFGIALQRRFGTPYQLNAADRLSEAPAQGVFELDKEIVVPSQDVLNNAGVTEVTMAIVGQNTPESQLFLWDIVIYDSATMNGLVYEINNGEAAAVDYAINIVYEYRIATISRNILSFNLAAGATRTGRVNLNEELLVFDRGQAGEFSQLDELTIRVVPAGGARAGSAQLAFTGRGRLDGSVTEYG